MSRRALIALAPFALAALALAGTVNAGPPADTTPPVITVTISPASPDGNAGWYRTSPFVDWTVTEDDSPSSVTTVGCVDQTIGETSGTSLSCQATSDGGTAGPVSTGTIKVDLNPPAIASGPVTIEATGPSGAAYTIGAADAMDPSPSVSCAPIPSGGTFPYSPPNPTTTSTTCTATDEAGHASAATPVQVTVQDTIGPTLSPSPPAAMTVTEGDTVTYTTPTASDAVGVAGAVSCSPASPFQATVSTTVSCSAVDTSGNPSSAWSFSVTVNEPPNTPPSIDVSGAASVEATGPSGGSLTYRYVASDLEDGTPAVLCDQPVGAAIPVDGSLTVTCTATDSDQASATDSLTQSAVDTIPPSVTVPASMTVEPTDPSGAVVTYTVSATDLVDGAVTPTCSPPSGFLFPLGLTQVTCTATDAHGNKSAPIGFSVSVQDRSAPTVTAPASRVVEANGPTGAVVSWETPTATDIVDGPIAPVTCNRPSGSTFPLGVTLVTCSATDSEGNTGHASFTISVVDTTPPVLTIPPDLAVQSSGPVPSSDQRIQQWAAGVTATDIVDTSPTVSTNMPSSFPLGKTTVVFTATDDEGNKTEKSAVVTITTDPVPNQPSVDTTPPANVGNVRAIVGHRAVSIAWQPPRKDFDHVTITQSPGRQGEPATVVYQGKKTSIVVRGLIPGVEYRFVIVTYDKAGNRSAGVAVVALAEEQTLLSPVNGAVLTSAPLIRWTPVKGARYYNGQVWFQAGATARTPVAVAKLRKVLSVWPGKPSFKMKRRWTFEGKRYTLRPGRYVVFVWPGLGPKAAGRYGKLHVEAEFYVRKR